MLINFLIELTEEALYMIDKGFENLNNIIKEKENSDIEFRKIVFLKQDYYSDKWD